MHYMLKRPRLNVRDKKQEQAFRASRLSGTRSIEVALAEIKIIKHNVYVQRQERSLPEDEISICSCKPPEDKNEIGCLDGCLNRAVSDFKCLEQWCED
ncbi:hypothetical protein PsorP6_002087 [Peronosclerospora sorghi]|uniref:Uncharacterized protein n=1 Tax=Peronosclerospora sorghi TaxID=230839 RepID=A0ACC0WWB8_9STRA|nr:hypothetical protein PsorP6_002087 [Peronosclerospora sorghi]